MEINEMEFQWRLNWWYRPTQCDAFGISVTDYYECFCDWKDSMTINSCPADEADYVDAFIQNLKPDIRLRLESKGRPSTRRLGDAFDDAKLEESLISIDEAFKMIKAKLEAHELFDKLPSQVSAVYQEHSSDEVDSCLHVSSVGYCSNKLAEDLYEFPGLEDGDESDSGEHRDFNGKMDSHNGVDEVFDEFSEPDIEEMPHPNSINLDVVHGSCSGMSIEDHGDVDKVLKSEPNGGLKPFAAGVQCMNRAMKFDLAELETPELNSTEHFEEHNSNDNSTPLIVYVRRVFDPGSGTTEHVYPNGSTILEIKGTFTPLLIHSLISLKDIGADIMLIMPWPSFCIYNELIQPSVIETASSKSSTGNFCSISIVEKVGMFSLNAGVQLMDTGRELFLSKEGLKCCEYSAVCLPNDWGYEASVIIILELDVYFCVDVLLIIIFDPGGSPLHYKGFSSLKANSVMQNLYFRLKEEPLGTCRIHPWLFFKLDLAMPFAHPNECLDWAAITSCGLTYSYEIETSVAESMAVFGNGDASGHLGRKVTWLRIGYTERPKYGVELDVTIFHISTIQLQALIRKELLGPGCDEEASIANGVAINLILAEAIPTKYGFTFDTGWTISDNHDDNFEVGKHSRWNFRLCMLPCSYHFPEGRFPGGYKNVVLLKAIILESFVWDPGLDAIFFFPCHMLSWCYFAVHPWGQG